MVNIHDCLYVRTDDSGAGGPPPPAAVDIHVCLYVRTDDGGVSPPPPSSVRTYKQSWIFTIAAVDCGGGGVGGCGAGAGVSLVGPAEFFYSLGNTGNVSTAVSPTSWSSTDRNTTTVRLKSNPTTPTPADCIACTTSNGDIEEWSCRTWWKTVPPLI